MSKASRPTKHIIGHIGDEFFTSQMTQPTVSKHGRKQDDTVSQRITGKFDPLSMGARRRRARGALAPGNVESVFLLQMLSKVSADEVFMHYFEKCCQIFIPYERSYRLHSEP